MEDRRTVEAVDVTARNQINNHEELCALRYDGIRRDYDKTIEILDKINTKLDNFRTLVFISVIIFFVGVAASLYKSSDRFTGSEAKQLDTRIEQLEKELGGTKR